MNRVDIDEFTYMVMNEDGGIQITKPTALGTIVTHTIHSPYSLLDIGVWLYIKNQKDVLMKPIQDVFPEMKPEDREFLMTGITPELWLKMFPPEDEDPNRDGIRLVEGDELWEGAEPGWYIFKDGDSIGPFDTEQEAKNEDRH